MTDDIKRTQLEKFEQTITDSIIGKKVASIQIGISWTKLEYNNINLIFDDGTKLAVRSLAGNCSECGHYVLGSGVNIEVDF